MKNEKVPERVKRKKKEIFFTDNDKMLLEWLYEKTEGIPYNFVTSGDTGVGSRVIGAVVSKFVQNSMMNRRGPKHAPEWALTTYGIKKLKELKEPKIEILGEPKIVIEEEKVPEKAPEKVTEKHKVIIDNAKM